MRVLPALASAAVIGALLTGVAGAADGGPCPGGALDIGTACLSTDLQTADGQASVDWFKASRECSRQGGSLPSADQLIGAADRLRLAGRLDDDPATAALETDAGRGLHDLREMTSALITARAGSSAAGSLGSSEQAKGDPTKGEPDPAPTPADSTPTGLQYVTVIDAGNRGGFAGSVPVGEPSRFRCAFARQGTSAAAGAAAPAPASGEAVARSTVTAPTSVSVATLRRSGVIAEVRCPAVDCAYTVALQISNPTARRLGLTTSLSKPATLATNGNAAEVLAAGSSARVRLRPSRTATTRMSYWFARLRLKGTSARVVLSVLEDGKRRTVTRALRIRA